MIVVNKLPIDVGEKIKLEKVLLVGSTQFTVIGTPLVKLVTRPLCAVSHVLIATSKDAVNVQATVIEQMKTKKVDVFKKKRRKGYTRFRGQS